MPLIHGCAGRPGMHTISLIGVATSASGKQRLVIAPLLLLGQPVTLGTT